MHQDKYPWYVAKIHMSKLGNVLFAEGFQLHPFGGWLLHFDVLIRGFPPGQFGVGPRIGFRFCKELSPNQIRCKGKQP